MARLKRMCGDKLATIVDEDNLLALFALGVRNHYPPLKEAAQRFLAVKWDKLIGKESMRRLMADFPDEVGDAVKLYHSERTRLLFSDM